jgi:hypothetical protein
MCVQFVYFVVSISVVYVHSFNVDYLISRGLKIHWRLLELLKQNGKLINGDTRMQLKAFHLFRIVVRSLHDVHEINAYRTGHVCLSA